MAFKILAGANKPTVMKTFLTKAPSKVLRNEISEWWLDNEQISKQTIAKVQLVQSSIAKEEKQ